MEANDRQLARELNNVWLAMQQEQEEQDVHYDALVQENKLAACQAAKFRSSQEAQVHPCSRPVEA